MSSGILVFRLGLARARWLPVINRDRGINSEVLCFTIRRGRLRPVPLPLVLSSSLGRGADWGKVNRWEVWDWMEHKPVGTSWTGKHDNIRV